MKLLSKHSALTITVLLGVYYSLLYYIYENILSPRWAYNGFINEYSQSRYYYSLLGLAVSILCYCKTDKKNIPSADVMKLFIILLYIPMYVLYVFIPMITDFYVFLLLYQAISYITYLYLNFNFKNLLPRNPLYFFSVIGFILIATLLINGVYNGFQIKIDLSDVYENRLAARDLKLPAAIAYIKSFAYMVGILALLYALETKNRTVIISIVFIQLMSFAFGASKTQFFSIFVCFIAHYFYSNKLRYWAPIALSIILIISIVEVEYFSSFLTTDIFTRRTLFVPSKISYNMYDFFENAEREFLYWRGSILRVIGLNDPYASENGFQRLIGSIYSNNEETNANTGLLGNDYAQFGWGALFIFPLLRAYFLKLYDYCAIGVNTRITAVLSIFIAFSYISGQLFTVLITKGILIICYLLYCYPRGTIHKNAGN